MIIDSHAHYTHNSFKNTFRYLALTPEGYTIQEGDRAQLFRELEAADIACAIEPGIRLDTCPEVLALAAQYPGRIFPAIGVHPTRCVSERWANRRRLPALAKTPGVVAIGETGLDYHHPRKEQHRLRQKMWFFYQLGLARRLRLPLILHVRMAHRPALRILKWHPARRLGGVIHCFNGDADTAQKYLRLGYHLGIGGAILQPPERAEALWEAVRQTPLDRILVETDAPFILPYCKDVLPGKALRRTRNTSLILPAVIEKIAQLKGLSPQQVEAATRENTIRLFRLPVK